MKFTYDRFLTEKANANRFLLEPVDRVEVVDRYTVKFLLKEPFVWLVDTLAYPWSTWIMAPEVAQQYGDFKKPETVIGTGPFILERYEPNVKAVFKRNPEYYRQGQPHIDGVEWLIVPDESTALAMYRTGQVDGAATKSCRAATGPGLGQTESSPPDVSGYPVHRRRWSSCAWIWRPSTMCACAAPSPMPSIARRPSTRSMVGAFPTGPWPAACGVGAPTRSTRRGRQVLYVRSQGGQAPAGRSGVSQGI